MKIKDANIEAFNVRITLKMTGQNGLT